MSTSASNQAPGRNDPCPCGSGKKYKKCCANRVTTSESERRRLLQQAHQHFNQGAIAETDNLCRLLLAVNPADSDANYLMGLVRYRQGNLGEAKSLLENAFARDPDNALLNTNLGHINELLGNLAIAREYCERAIKLSPKLADPYNILGNVLTNYPDSASIALKNYAKAMELAPTNPGFTMNVASSLHKNGKLGEAEKYYLKVIELAPGWVDPMKNIGTLYFQQGNSAKAQSYLENALAIDAHDEEAILNLSLVKKRAGDVEGAEKLLLDLDKLHPDQARAQLELASLYQSFGWQDEMLSACKKAAEREPRNPQVYLEWAKYEEGRHNLVHAQELAEKAETLGFSGQDLLRARIARRHKDWNLALLEVEKIDPDKLEGEAEYKYFYEKGYVLDKLGKFDEAWVSFGEAAKRKKQNESIEFNLKHQEDRLRDLEGRYDIEFVNWLSKKSKDQLALPGIKPLFIIGFPRSGTTLLEQILCSHPNISAGDELPYIREIGIRLYDRLGNIKRHSNGINENAESEIIEFLLDSRRYYLDQVRKLKVVDLNGNYFTDKMPLNLNHLPLIHLLFPESPIVHIVRNPMDTCLSNYFSNFGSGNQHTLDINDCAAYYKLTFEYAERNRNRIDGLNYLQIRYEDLVRNQETVTRRVIDFVGEPWDDACLSHHLTRRVARTISYEEVTRKVYTSSVSRYRHYKKYLEKPLGTLGPLMKKLDYIEREEQGPEK